jgi:AraC-like DNA-binding protein
MIKNLVNKVRKKDRSILLKSFLLNSALATVIVIALVLSIFFWLQRRSLEDINSSTRLMLNNMKYKTDELFKGTNALAYQLFKNNNCTELMMSRERDVSNEQRISVMIDNIMISTPYLQSVYICNAKKVLMRKDRGSYYDAETDGQIFDLIYASGILAPIQRIVPVAKGENLNLFSIIYQEAYPNNKSMDSAVIVNINAEKMYRYISSLSASGDSSTFVINSKGDMLAGADKSMFAKNLSGEEYIDTILQDPSPEGVYYITVDKEKFAVNFVRSQDNKMIFISVDPYRTITAKLNRSKDFILIVCLLVLLILLISYFLLTLRIFRPVTQIINNIKANSGRLGLSAENPRDEFRYISQTLAGVMDYINILDKREKDNVYILRNNFIWSLLNERENQPSYVELEKEFAAHKIDFDPGQPFAVVVLRIDDYKSYIRSNSAKSKNLLLFSIGNIACELLGEIYSSYAFETDSDHEILLVNVAATQIREFEEEIAQYLKTVGENVEKFLNTTITAGVSDVSEEAGQIGVLYRQALVYTNYRLIHGPGGLFTRGTIPGPGGASCDKELKDVVQAVKDGSRAAFSESFGRLLEKMQLYNYERVVKLFTDLYAEIMKVPGNLKLNAGMNGDMDIIGVFRTISGMENPTELRGFFEELFERVSGQVTSANQLGAKDLIQDAIRYIEANYRDTQISGNSVAKHLGLSPQYFSKVFTDNTGCGFPEYLNRVRLEKARELLLNSDRNAFEIGEMVGYTNRSYFSTLFKKEYGVSPSKYRLLKAKADR